MARATRPANRSSPAFADQIGEFPLGEPRDQIGGARPIPSHPHIERSVMAEREAALGLVDLHRRDAEIERDTRNRTRFGLGDEPFHVAEAAFNDLEPAGVPDGETGAARDRVGIAVDAEHAAVRRGQQRLGVTAGTERAVDVERAVPRCKRGDNLGDKNGFVFARGQVGGVSARFGHDGRRAAPLAGSVVPCWRERSRTAARCSA